MIGTREFKKQNSDNSVPIKNNNIELSYNYNSCGSCNACHHMTKIHSATISPVFGGGVDGEHGANLQKACANNFFQRYMGNTYMQSIAGNRQPLGLFTSRSEVPKIQRKYACDGSSSRCDSREEELKKIPNLNNEQVDNMYERKADRVAKQMTMMPELFAHAKSNSKPSHCCNSDKTKRQSLLQRLTSYLATKENHDDSSIGRIFGDKANAVDGKWLSTNISSGRSLDPSLQSEMEEKFGEDFSKVHIHTDSKADLIARTLNAQAVTVGQHIAFANGLYNPHTQTGVNILLHELVHTVQQKGVSGIPSINIPISRPLDNSEREADSLAQAVSNDHQIQSVRCNSLGSQARVYRISTCSALCHAICWASFTALCAAIAALCTAGSVITFGGLSIPCTPLVIGTCALSAYDASMCSDILCPEICGETTSESERSIGTSIDAGMSEILGSIEIS